MLLYDQKPLLGKLPLWTPNPAGIPPPVGTWIMNEGSGEIYDLITKTKATYTGNVVWDITQYGQGLNTTPNAVINTNVNQPYLALNSNYVWHIHFRCDAQVAENGTVFGNRFEGTASPLQFVKFTEIKFEYYNNGSDGSLTYPNRIVAGNYYDMIVTKIGTELKLYINGLFITSDTITQTMDANPIYIGAGDVDGVQECANITVISATIYNQALTPNQIDYLHQHPYYAWEYPEAWEYYVAAVAAGNPWYAYAQM